jgi:hypothetical protein
MPLLEIFTRECDAKMLCKHEAIEENANVPGLQGQTAEHMLEVSWQQHTCWKVTHQG